MRHLFSVFILSIVLATLPAPPGHAATLDQIRLSFQHDPRTTITITWRTDASFAPQVQYGVTASHGNEATGNTGPAVLDGFFYHTVELSNLTPNTLYHYRVNGPNNTWSSDYTFRTAPSGAADFSFTVFGDNGLDTMSGGNPRRIKDLVVAQNPTLHLIAGDLTYADSEGNKKSAWEQWFTEMGRISQTIPVMPALGNHERASSVKFSNGELFYTRSFVLPPEYNEEYYSFDYGDVHFNMINSDEYSSLRPGRTQYEWIRTDLANTNKRFKVAVFHHMAYSSGSRHSVLQDVQNNLSPLFDQYDVDLVFTGHNHQYERTYPLRYGSFNNPIIAATGNAYINPDATVYVVTGGGGRSSYGFNNPQPDWSANRCECNEIVRVDVDDAGVLTVRTIKIDGTIVDQFTISKTDAVITPPPIATAPTTQPTPVPSPTPITTSQPATLLTYVPNTQTIRGFNLAVWSRDALGRSDARKSLDNLKAAGANYVAFAPFWYQDNKTSTRIYRRDSKTATDDSVRAAIRYAKSLGLKVALKPMVDSRDNTWRGQFAPSDTNAWFQSYRDFILNFAQISKDEGVDYLIMGTEFTTLSVSEYSQKWRDIIRDIRAIYSGPLTYAANWGKRTDGEYYKIDWWDALDAIGIDAYFPVATDGNPTVTTVQNSWTSINSGGEQNWLFDIQALHERFNKPAIFTELGYLSCDGAGIKPWEYPCNKNIDLTEQATLYEGTLQFWSDKEWLQGFLFWRWDVLPDKGGINNGDYLVQSKPPSLDTLKRFWRESTPAISGGSASVRPEAEPRPIVIAPTTTSASSTISTPPTTAGNSSGGGVGLVTSTPSTSPTFPTGLTPTTRAPSSAQPLVPSTQSLAPRLFSYGKPRLPLWQERVRSWGELAVPLRAHFKGAIPLNQKHWPYYVNAYLYGNYPVAAIARGIELHGKTVHPIIPWSAWKKSPDYQKYIK